ncbi:hypothetical protein EG68_07453 [Paragonimus skrjabini miyazakii]|uniref:Uncharacterized protein n=1 Tax=Paragonimus skrjabini miyazakii TaxID=59628 RepID=A0A8S9YLB9_9TREM|nr:hypothetical protein EG68_07453 [Paragonimus skrjabini miyazakii]
MRLKRFTFSQSFDAHPTVNVEHSLAFPLEISLPECFRQMVIQYDVPPYAHDALRRELKIFIEKEKMSDFMVRYLDALNALTEGTLDVNHLCGRLDNAYRSHVSSYVPPRCASDDELFGQAYNRVIHSAQALDLIRLEQSLAAEVAAEVDKRDAVLRKMDEDLVLQTELGLQKRDIDIPTAVTQLQESHIRSRELEEGRWNSCISELKRIQRRSLRNFVMTLDEQCSLVGESKKSKSKSSGSARSDQFDLGKVSSSSIPSRLATRSSGPSTIRPWSESFTVQLGRQLRTTCNFRLIRADPMDLLINLGSNNSVNSATAPADGFHFAIDSLAERLSNALDIYSVELNGLVVLVDRRVNSFRGIKRCLAETCERSTEFHFPELSCQLTAIQDTVNRLGSRDSFCTPQSKNSAVRTNSVNGEKSEPQEPIHGDVYITKHSNLAGGIGGLAGGGGGISVLFHLVYDESTDREEDRIRSGSRLHCSLSAILRTCFDYDITTLSLPLLLVPALREYMDVSWRVRRAESSLKLLKGVLMELNTWRGPVVRSIQFLAPSELSDKELESFSHVISSSFLQPVPVVVAP